MKKKKKNKEKSKNLSQKRKCAECGAAISVGSGTHVGRKEHGHLYHFCSLDCYVVWEMRK